MVLRWVAAGVLDAAKGFRRGKGCKDMQRSSLTSGHATCVSNFGNRQSMVA